MAATNVQAFSGDVQIRGTTFIKANTNTDNLAIGTQAGETSQGNNAVAIGTEAGETSQGNNAVAIGYQAGETSQSGNSVAVGRLAGQSNQDINSVAVGGQAGKTDQGQYSIAVGYETGLTDQGAFATAVGSGAGKTSQAGGAVAVGRRAGEANQGSAAIAIGQQAGTTDQPANSIILNATGDAFNPTTASSFHVKPVRGGNFAASALAYTADGEIVEETGTHFDASGNIDTTGTVTATNLVRGVAEEAVRWNSQNETVFPQSATTRYYKIATLGTTGEAANGGKLRISGTIGGFGEDETTLIDAFVASRGGIKFGGTLTGYGSDNPSDVDFVVYVESDGTFSVWLKVIRFFLFDFTIMGAQVSNNTRTLAVLPCPTTDTSVTTPTGTLQGSVVDSCSVVFTDDGNVGIGVTDPTGVNGGNRLEGSSTTGFEYIATRDDTSVGAGDFIGAYLFKNTDTTGSEPHYTGMSVKAAGATGTMDLHFYSGRDNYENDTPQMTIDYNGNVGIGVTDPVITGLHVANSYNPSGGNTTHFDPQIYITGDIGGGTQVSAIGFNGNSAGEPHRRIVAGSVYYKGYTGNYGMEGYLGLAVADASVGGEDPYGLTEGELESHTRLAITNAGAVGIGTTDPDCNLEIRGSTSSIKITRASNGLNFGTTLDFALLNSANEKFTYGRITGAIADRTDGAENGFLSLQVGTDGNLRSNYQEEKMRILSNGNVGIGTDDPGAKLQTGPVDGDHLYMASSNNSFGWKFHVDDEGSGSVPLRIKRRYNGSDTTMITLLQNNYMGFGPDLTPDQFFHFARETEDDHLYMKFGKAQNNVTSGQYWKPYMYAEGNTSTGNYAGQTYYSNGMFIGCGQMNVAWGSSYYGGTVDIRGGDVRSAGNNGTAGSTYYYAGDVVLSGGIASTGTSTGQTSYTGGGSIIFKTQAADTSSNTDHNLYERMRVDGPTGRVGINDSTPSYTLDVNGSLRCFGFTDSSDDRIKYNEEDIPNALTLISQLKPQKYEKIMERPNPYEGTWIPTDEEWENVKGDYKHSDEYGFIAQDVRAVPELSFLVQGEETRTDTKTSTPGEYSNLTTEEQSTYTTSYVYESNVITQSEYSNLTPEEQGLYYTQYTKQIETQTPLALNYQGLFVVAIGAVKELKAKNDALEARITALESA